MNAQIDANGSILVTGSGSLLTFPNAGFYSELEVGVYSGSSSLNVTSNGNVSSGTFLFVGGFQSGTSGTLSISSSGSVTAPYPAFGFTPGTTGTGMVTGAGSILNATSDLELGGEAVLLHANGGTGTLTVSSGGAVNAAATTFYSNTSSININGGTLNTGGVNSNASGNGVIMLADPAGGTALTINGASGSSLYKGSISGAGSLQKSGGSIQTLSGTDTFTGSVLVTAGELAFTTRNQFSSLVVTGGTAQFSGSGNILVAPVLTVVGGGTVDITNDSADIGAPGLSSINTLVTNGFNGGLWTGTGLTSSSAAADTRHLTAVGVIQNNQSGTALYTASHQFEGITPGVSDILAKYTYYGDTNLDGKVDGSDYSRIDSAFVLDKTNPTAATGWFNGDFNYDGVINGSDYTLIDNAFNTQGALLAATLASPTAVATDQIATTVAVPEPTSLALLAIAATGILSRRKTVAQSDNALCFRRHI